MAPSDMPNIVVIGGGYAGLTAAARIAEAKTHVTVTLVDAKSAFVERIRLHEIAAGSAPRDLEYRDFMESRGGRFVQGRVTAIDAGGKNVEIASKDGAAAVLDYDMLIYALGSHTDLESVPGTAEHAFGLDTVETSIELARKVGILSKTGGKVLIAGGGLTAIEAACEFAERLPGLQVAIAPGRSFGPDGDPGGLSVAGHDHVLAVLERLNVDIVDGARIEKLEPDAAELEDGRSIPFDVCVWGAGFVVPTLAAEAGIRVNEAGQIVTDPTLTSVSHPDIVAVGDAAEVVVEPAGTCRMSCAAGRPMGERGAQTVLDHLAGREPAPFEFSYSFRCVSLGRDDGLIQFVDAQDRPVEEIWTGPRGARWKEYICRRTLNGVGFDDDLGPPPDTPPRFG
ncbi:MAG: NAD(P)/FAD-dependent oxidoreductase [Alphaproteobacteria bacterium]